MNGPPGSKREDSRRGASRIPLVVGILGVVVLGLGTSFRPRPETGRAVPRLACRPDHRPGARVAKTGMPPQGLRPVERREASPEPTPVDLADRWSLLFQRERVRAQEVQEGVAPRSERMIQESRENQVTSAILACELMERLGREPEAWEGVMDFLLRQESEEIYKSLVLALEPAQTPLSRARWSRVLLTDERPAARRRAAWVFSTSAAPEGLVALLSAFETDPDGDVREAALEAIAFQERIRPIAASAALIEASLRRRLDVEEEGSVRGLASQLLQRAEGESVPAPSRRSAGQRAF